MNHCPVYRPFFTVVIPVYNRSHVLERALNSVKAQNETDFEVIVVDDGSDTGYARLIQNLIATTEDERIRLISYTAHRNGAYARNVGIHNAKGRYISFLDSDDEWHKNKLARVRQTLEQGNDRRVLYHQYRNIQNGSVSNSIPKIGIRKHQSVTEYSFCQNHGGGIQSSCLTVETDLAKQVRFNEALPAHQDWDFVLRLSDNVDYIAFIKQPFTRRHISANGETMVSRSASYDTSYKFLQEYRQYFSPKAKAAYAAFILEPRRLKNIPRGAFTYVQLLAWLYYPAQCTRERRKLHALNKRCRRLVDYCRQHKITSVCLVGYNDYTRNLLHQYGNKIPVTVVIDRNKRGNLDSGLKVCPMEEIDSDQWRKIGLVVTVTDRHHESMRKGFSKIAGLAFYAF